MQPLGIWLFSRVVSTNFFWLGPWLYQARAQAAQLAFNQAQQSRTGQRRGVCVCVCVCVTGVEGGEEVECGGEEVECGGEEVESGAHALHFLLIRMYREKVWEILPADSFTHLNFLWVCSFPAWCTHFIWVWIVRPWSLRDTTRAAMCFGVVEFTCGNSKQKMNDAQLDVYNEVWNTSLSRLRQTPLRIISQKQKKQVISTTAATTTTNRRREDNKDTLITIITQTIITQTQYKIHKQHNNNTNSGQDSWTENSYIRR